MVSYEKLLEGIENIQEYCEATPKFSEFLGTVKDIRIELEFQRIAQLNIEQGERLSPRKSDRGGERCMITKNHGKLGR